MPDLKFMPPDQQERMFGDPTWQQQCAERWATMPGGMLMYAMGILSDAQEVLAAAGGASDASREVARQCMNKAKHVMREYCVTKPMAREEETLRALLNEQDYALPDNMRQDLRWLMDPRR